jgi:NAD(P)-dependent dehydrogenase (short-subunit alcohol dehydrogenase family)
MGRHWINVNVVCPSIVDTPMISTIPPEIREKIPKAYPLRRLGRPEDIADAVLFLASARASWITGQAVGVDGGYVMA